MAPARFPKTPRGAAAGFTLAAVLWAAAAAAGVETIPAPAGTPDVPPHDPAATVQVIARQLGTPGNKPGRGKSRSTLRCWQYGRLIFEEPLNALPPDLAARSRSFEGKGSQSLQLLDIHTATCLVQ